jgi:hypothetical protein
MGEPSVALKMEELFREIPSPLLVDGVLRDIQRRVSGMDPQPIPIGILTVDLFFFRIRMNTKTKKIIEASVRTRRTLDIWAQRVIL